MSDRKPFDYLEAEPAPDAPISDNPSGLYCTACRGLGLWHCSEVDYCGSMRRMRPASRLSEGTTNG